MNIENYTKPSPTGGFSCNTSTGQCRVDPKGIYGPKQCIATCKPPPTKPAPIRGFSCNTAGRCYADPKGPYGADQCIAVCTPGPTKPAPTGGFSCNTSTGQCSANSKGPYGPDQCIAVCKPTPTTCPTHTCPIHTCSPCSTGLKCTSSQILNKLKQIKNKHPKVTLYGPTSDLTQSSTTLIQTNDTDHPSWTDGKHPVLLQIPIHANGCLGAPTTSIQDPNFKVFIEGGVTVTPKDIISIVSSNPNINVNTLSQDIENIITDSPNTKLTDNSWYWVSIALLIIILIGLLTIIIKKK